MVDGVLRNLDGHRSILHARLAREARGELEPPGLVEEIVLLLRGRSERLVALAHDHMASRARAALLACVLDLDVVLEKRVADGNAGARLDACPLGAKGLVGKHREHAHREAISSSLRPASAPETARSMRRAANAPLAWLSASIAALMARWSVELQARSRTAMRWSSTARSSSPRRSASRSSAARVAASSDSASTRCSASARASRSSIAWEKLSCSMRATSSSESP